jgi:hypothetical protein
VGDALWQSLAWSIGIIAVFAYLSIQKDNQAVSE